METKPAKLTPQLKGKYKNTVKGQVYLFIVAANNLAFAEQYKYQKIDTGAKEPLSWINAKVEELIKPTTGPYWNDEFKGFDIILESAKKAKQSIVSSVYDQDVADFIDTTLTSFIPKGEKKIEPESAKEKISKLKDMPEIHLPKGLTGAEIKRNKLREAEEAAKLEMIGDLADQLEDVNPADLAEMSDEEFDALENEGTDGIDDLADAL